MPTPITLGFLGAGQMATALARSWITAGMVDPANSLAADPSSEARAAFTAATGIPTVATNLEVAKRLDLVILAVKPQIVPAVLAEMTPAVNESKLLISIAAGITLAQLAQGLNDRVRLIRVMPNTPALVGTGASAVSPGPNALAADRDLVLALFRHCGVVHAVPEKLLDAVTGLSGSGPALVYVFIEALADGGVRAGLPRDIALSLATQTVLGSAQMVRDTKQHPAALKDAVASPGGTTIAGLHAAESAGFRAAVMDFVVAAAERATVLGNQKPS